LREEKPQKERGTQGVRFETNKKSQKILLLLKSEYNETQIIFLII
jgi:hypothetical protein